jgi:hypothetical protein
MTHHNHIKAGLVAALAGGAFMATGCGESTPEAADTAARSTKVDVTQFLMRDGEQPGFRRVERVRTDSAETFVQNTPQLTEADKARIRSDGMGPLTFQPTEGPNTRGVTSVTLFATEKGAGHWLAHEQQDAYIRQLLPAGSSRLRHFDVPGIPGAFGWTATLGGSDHRVGNVMWVQGRCMMVLGNEGLGPFAGPLSTGARAVYARTQGQCP